MSVMSKLQELACSLPNSSTELADLPKVLQDAIYTGDADIIKKFLSNNKTNADMTRITIY